MNTQHPDTSKPDVIASAVQTRKQATASLLAKGLADKAQWKTLIGEAHNTWPQVSAAELAASEGNIHALAGLVQLRHRVSRELSDQQVTAFFAAHLSPEHTAAQNR